MVGIPLRWGRAEPLVEVAGSGHIGVDLLVMPCVSGDGFIEEEARDGDVVLYVNWRAVVCGAYGGVLVTLGIESQQ